MDGLLYPASLVIIVLLAFTFMKNNNSVLMFVVLVIGVYIIYSHETGHTATEFKNEMVDSIDESAQEYSKSYNTENYDASKAEEAVK